jgi:hypothetical protein
MNRVKPIYDRAAHSFNHTIRPNTHTDDLIRYARAELASMLPDPSASLSSYVAVHIRRGDRNGMSWGFHNAPVPVAEHAKAVVEVWARLRPEEIQTTPVVFAASDDANALDELRELLPMGTILFDLADSAVSRLQEVASKEPYIQVEFDQLDEALRMRRTTGMIVDFALLSGMWRGKDDMTPLTVVCGIACVLPVSPY